MINVLPYRLNPSSDTDGKWENNEESGAAFATVVNFCLMWSRLSDEERALCPWWHSHCSSLCHIYKPGTKVKKRKTKRKCGIAVHPQMPDSSYAYISISRSFGEAWRTKVLPSTNTDILNTARTNMSFSYLYVRVTCVLQHSRFQTMYYQFVRVCIHTERERERNSSLNLWKPWRGARTPEGLQFFHLAFSSESFLCCLQLHLYRKILRKRGKVILEKHGGGLLTPQQATGPRWLMCLCMHTGLPSFSKRLRWRLLGEEGCTNMTYTFP